MREHVDLPTVEAMQREWRRNPPVHHLVAAYLEYKPPAGSSSSSSGSSTREDPDVDGLMAFVGDQVPVIAHERYTPIDTTAFDAAMAELATKRALEVAAANS